MTTVYYIEGPRGQTARTTKAGDAERLSRVGFRVTAKTSA